MAGLLEKLDARQTPARPVERIGQASKNRELLLLDWLMNRWTKNSVTLRDVLVFGPGCVRDREVALSLMQTLVARRWVAEVKAHRYDMKRWGIARGPIAPQAAQPQP
jgi:hypothetical protein